MEKLDVVKRYLDIVFSKPEDLKELRTIFTADLEFRGPFFAFDSADSYIESLVVDPLENASYELIDLFVRENKVSIMYNFTKTDIKTPMAQLFEFRGDLIQKILLIFNAQDFD